MGQQYKHQHCPGHILRRHHHGPHQACWVPGLGHPQPVMLEKELCQDLNNSKSRDRLGRDTEGWSGGGRRRNGVEWTWTNFHCALCLGVGGFVIFWIFLLARMYLPMENALMTWWLGKNVTKVPAATDSLAGITGAGGIGDAMDPTPSLLETQSEEPKSL